MKQYQVMTFYTACVLMWNMVSVSVYGSRAEWAGEVRLPPLEEMEDEGLSSPPSTSTPSSLLGCWKQLFKARVHREDEQGRRCSGTVTLAACAGRCDSHEISEWRFPWKRSRHPVCGFGGRSVGVAVLGECEEGAGAGARLLPLVRPSSCSCRPCSAASTSCGWLPLPLPLPQDPTQDTPPLPLLDTDDTTNSIIL